MSNYNIEILKGTQQMGPVKRWWLDFPSAQQDASLAQLTETGLIFQGWVLLAKPEEVDVYVKQQGELSRFPLNKARSDVVEIILKQPATEHPQLHCGFRFNLIMSSAQFELGILHAGVEYALCQGNISGPFKVLRGKAPWLFLDNDTNKSVEQHTGKLLIEPEQLVKWQQYLDYLARQQTVMPTAMLIAPSKEHVYPQFYPFDKAPLTAFDQFLALKQVHEIVINPVARLQQSERRSFRVTDTHWSPYGACVASMMVAEHFGLADAEMCFAADKFKHYQVAGDLGKKLFPPQAHEEEFLSGFSYRPSVIYDNALPNFGRVLVMANPKATLDKHLLLFGSSSAYSMLDYLVRLYSRVTLIHTAGNVDTEVLAAVQPDYLLTQTNARFVIRAPVVGYDLVGIMAEKLGTAEAESNTFITQSAAQLVKFADNTAKLTSGTGHEVLLQYFHSLLLRAAG